MMLGDKITAEEAERIGMIYKFFADDTFEQEAKKIATTLAQMPTRGLWYTKQALTWSFSQYMERTIDE